MPLKTKSNHANPYPISLSYLLQIYTHPMSDHTSHRLHAFFSSISLTSSTPDTKQLAVLTAYQAEKDDLPQPLLLAYHIPSDNLQKAYDIINQYHSVIIFEIKNTAAYDNLASYFEATLYERYHNGLNIDYSDMIKMLQSQHSNILNNELLASQFGANVETHEEWINNFPFLLQKIQEISNENIQPQFPGVFIEFMPFLESIHLLFVAEQSTIAVTDLPAYRQFLKDDEYRLWQSFIQAC